MTIVLLFFENGNVACQADDSEIKYLPFQDKSPYDIRRECDLLLRCLLLNKVGEGATPNVENIRNGFKEIFSSPLLNAIYGPSNVIYGPSAEALPSEFFLFFQLYLFSAIALNKYSVLDKRNL